MARILVIDNDETAIAALGEWLPTIGHTPVFARAAGAALTLYRLHLPELLIIEAEVPGGGGELLGLLRREPGAWPPAIIMSVLPPDQLADILGQPRVFYINRPFSGPEFMAAINGALAAAPVTAQVPVPAPAKNKVPARAAAEAAPSVTQIIARVREQAPADAGEPVPAPAPEARPDRTQLGGRQNPELAALIANIPVPEQKSLPLNIPAVPATPLMSARYDNLWQVSAELGETDVEHGRGFMEFDLDNIKKLGEIKAQEKQVKKAAQAKVDAKPEIPAVIPLAEPLTPQPEPAVPQAEAAPLTPPAVPQAEPAVAKGGAEISPAISAVEMSAELAATVPPDAQLRGVVAATATGRMEASARSAQAPAPQTHAPAEAAPLPEQKSAAEPAVLPAVAGTAEQAEAEVKPDQAPAAASAHAPAEPQPASARETLPDLHLNAAPEAFESAPGGTVSTEDFGAQAQGPSKSVRHGAGMPEIRLNSVPAPISVRAVNATGAVPAEAQGGAGGLFDAPAAPVPHISVQSEAAGVPAARAGSAAPKASLIGMMTSNHVMRPAELAPSAFSAQAAPSSDETPDQPPLRISTVEPAAAVENRLPPVVETAPVYTPPPPEPGGYPVSLDELRAAAAEEETVFRSFWRE